MVIYELWEAVRDIISNSENPGFEADLIVMETLSINRTEYTLKKKDKIGERYINRAMDMAHRRKSGEPLQYILGNAEFMGMKFLLTEDTLIPRADTECLVEAVIKRVGNARGLKILDIGCGSGCIGISLAKLCGAEITMLDISEGALSAAEKNAKLNDVRASFIKCDILKEVPYGKYDIIVSNPPYIKHKDIDSLAVEVKDYEPSRALDGGEDGLKFYRRIADIAERFAVNGGLVAFEIGFDQGDAVKALMKNFSEVECIKDLCKNDRVVLGRLP